MHWLPMAGCFATLFHIPIDCGYVSFKIVACISVNTSKTFSQYPSERCSMLDACGLQSWIRK
jgi:hypothetical protein